jgi:uncharacterized protein
MENIRHQTSSIEQPMFARPQRHWMLDVPQLLLVLAIRIYRLAISPAQAFLFGNTFGCRFTPTCSAYGMEALRAHGAMRGSLLTAKRICRCHPWGDCGHDPVPVKFTHHASRITH